MLHKSGRHLRWRLETSVVLFGCVIEGRHGEMTLRVETEKAVMGAPSADLFYVRY